jgi:Protein of unknown function (DUF2800)
MSEGHAFCAPSDWEGWSNCPGKPALEEHEPDEDSPYAAEGTLAHEWAATWLRHGGGDIPPQGMPDTLVPGVRLYVTAIRERIAAFRQAGARTTLLVEQKLDISVVTGERGARGTGDAVLIAEFPEYSVLDVWDLKYGVGVLVSPIENGQEMIYALAAIALHGLTQEFREVNLVIHQPRVAEHPQEWRVPLEQLYLFGAKVTEAAALSLSLRGEATALSHLNPGEAQCRFCRAKYRCPALIKVVHEEVFTEFQKESDPRAVPVPIEDRALVLPPDKKALLLARGMGRVKLIEEWCLATRAAVDRSLLAGESVPGFKLVGGRKGARAWTDEEAAAMLACDLSGMPYEGAFTKPRVVTPTQMETILKDAQPEVWATMQGIIKQAEGKPSVAPESDPRPPWSAHSVEDFDSHDVSALC